MYIRKVSQKKSETGKTYFTHRLVETYRNQENKVRQRVLLNLGTNFNIVQDEWKLLADRVEEIMSGQAIMFEYEQHIEKMAQDIAKRVIRREANFTEHKQEEIKSYQEVDVNTIESQNIRSIGPEYLGIETARELKLNHLLKELKFNNKQINTALGSIIGKLVAPGSERSTHKYLQNISGLDDLLGCDFQQLSLNQLYQISDKLVKSKEIIEQRLFSREQELFELDDVITLYDLTNTYFEGKGLCNSKAAFGRSKEKRRDCPLVTLALVLDSSGFPKRSEVFEGNASEPRTLQKMINKLCKEGEKPTVVLDAGISSEENLSWLKEEKYSYIAVSRKAKQILPDKEDFIIEHKKEYQIKAKLIDNKETGEKELYCHSQAKEEKEKSMFAQASSRYEQKLKEISESLSKQRTKKGYQHILQRIGRLKEKYKQVSKAYEVIVATDDKKETVTAIKWEQLPTKQKTPGVYCLRTNRQDLTEQTFWNIYIMLTNLEAAFRCLKTELGLRPVYHQKTKRVDGHIFITVLAYHLMHSIRCKLKAAGIHESWLTIRKELFNHCRITTSMKLKNGKTLHIRKSSRPTPRQIEIYKALKLNVVPGKTEKTIL